MSGIPKLDSHFAGLSMSSKVVLQALDSRTFKLAVSACPILENLMPKFSTFSRLYSQENPLKENLPCPNFSGPVFFSMIQMNC